MAIKLAAELDVTPEEALLLEVRRSAARSAWLDDLVADSAQRYEEVRVLNWMAETEDNSKYGIPRSLIDLNTESRRERHHGAQVAKMAIDAEVMVSMSRNLTVESKILFAALVAALDYLGITGEDRSNALNAARLELTSGITVDAS